jgi:hypothetical protein
MSCAPVDEEGKLLAAAILNELSEDGLVTEGEHLLENNQLKGENSQYESEVAGVDHDEEHGEHP